jgi:hypothetical protein
MGNAVFDDVSSRSLRAGCNAARSIASIASARRRRYVV